MADWLHYVTGGLLRKRSAIGTWGVFLGRPNAFRLATQAPHFIVTLAALAAMLLLPASTVTSALFDEDGGLKVAVLAPFGATWLVWSRRDQIRSLAVRTWWPGLLVVALISSLWVCAEAGEINFLRHVGLIGILWALVATTLGLAMVRTLAIPLLFLLFAANLFFPLVPILMQLSAQIGVHALRLMSVPVELDGLFFLTPVGRWQVTEGCSGLDYVLIFAMAGCLYSSLAFHSILRKVLFVFAAAGAAVLANGLRFWGIVYVAYLRDGVDMDHSLIGYIAFALVFAMLFAAGYRLGEPPLELPAPRSQRSAAATSKLGATVLAALASLAIAGCASGAVSVMQERSRGQTAFDGCHQLEPITVQRDGASVVQARTQCSGPSGIKQLPSVPETVLHKTLPIAALRTGTRVIEKSAGSDAIDAATLTTVDAEVAYRLTYWYEVGDAATGSWVAMKWNRALALLLNHDAAVTVVSEVEKVDKPR